MTPKKVLLGAVLSVLATIALAFTVSAAADGGGGKGNATVNRGNPVYRALLVGSKPAPTDPPIHNVAPGSVPWDGGGRVILQRNGSLNVRIRGLVITGVGNAGPVTTVSASLYCEGSDKPAATTQTVPLSQKGDARIRTTLTLPATCLGPIVLVHPNGTAGAYIAAPGWRG